MPSPNRSTMLATRNPNYPGVRIKALRLALGITTRGVEDYSRRIARLGGNKAFLIPHRSVREMEKPGAEPPGIYKLFSPWVVCRLSLTGLLEIFGVVRNGIPGCHTEIQLLETHLLSPDGQG